MNDNDLIRERQEIISLLTTARLERGISQQALAEMTGTKRSNICRMESGAQNVSLDTFLKVAHALGKNIRISLEEENQSAQTGSVREASADAEIRLKESKKGTRTGSTRRITSGTVNRSEEKKTREKNGIKGQTSPDTGKLPEVRKTPFSGSYSLRLYDDELLTFSLTDAGPEDLKAHILSVNGDRRKVFPLDLELTDSGILKWLRGRMIPKSRTYADEILKALDLDYNDTKGIIDVSMGLSLNDSFWVVPLGFTGRFKDYNLYQNHFSDALSLIAFTGAGQSSAAFTGTGQSGEAFTLSPELTTHGMLPKAWRRIEGDGIYLYKGGTSGAANAGREPYSEYYACQIAERMGLNAVHYELETWEDIPASRCRLFTNINTSYIPIGNLVKTGGIKACLAYFAAIGPDALDAVKSMLVFDAVICNEDRSFENFGILRDNHTGRILGAAPVFDNGMSLFNYAMPEDFRDLSKYAATRTTPYGLSFEEVFREACGNKQRAQLKRLIDFRFERHPSINLPEEHLQAIEEEIGRRVQELLALPTR